MLVPYGSASKKFKKKSLIMASEQTHKLYTQLLSNIVKSTCNLSCRTKYRRIPLNH